MLNTPVLFLVFNRLDTTKRVFAKIREIQPRQLFIGSDGAREGKEGESEKVEAVRGYILENIDWDCEIKTLFRDKNLGCGLAVSQAITWFFEQVEQGIILEDDCLPDLSFFGFCEELLNYYKDDDRVMHISGSNFQFGKTRGKASYYFSNYAPIWGWATWKRAWVKYQFDLQKIKYQQLEESFGQMFNKDEVVFWRAILLKMQSGDRIDTWDLQWCFSIWANKGVAVSPNVNMIANIGFRSDATHTKYEDSKVANMNTKDIYQIKHLKDHKINAKADKFTFYNHVSQKETIIRKFKNLIIKVLKIRFSQS